MVRREPTYPRRGNVVDWLIELSASIRDAASLAWAQRCAAELRSLLKSPDADIYIMVEGLSLAGKDIESAERIREGLVASFYFAMPEHSRTASMVRSLVTDMFAVSPC